MKNILNKISYFLGLIYWFFYFLIVDTKYGMLIFLITIFGLPLWYGICYEPGRYCKYCGEGAEYRSYIYYHPCKSSNSGKHNIEFYWKKPENGHTRADELSKYIE